MAVTYDLVLSSGFLAFARHAGFLAAVEDVRLPVGGICGTSSGALVSSLWASGMPAAEVLSMLTARRPISWARPHWAPWQGAFRLDGVVSELRTRLPSTFAGLDRPFAVGVATPGGGHRLLDAGPLPEAVAASCAVPWLFAPVEIGGERLYDGGAVDRLGLGGWRERRPDARLVVHRVDASGTGSEPDLTGLHVVRSPRSGASMFSLGDVRAAFDLSRAEARRVLDRL